MDADLRLESQVCFALYAASRATTAAYRPALAALDLTYPQYLVLLALWEHDGLTVGDLGRRLQLDSGTLSPLLRRLERNGVVRRHRDPDDERRVTVELTPHGRDLRDDAPLVQRSLLDCIDLDTDELRTLRSLLHRITDRTTHTTDRTIERTIEGAS